MPSRDILAEVVMASRPYRIAINVLVIVVTIVVTLVVAEIAFRIIKPQTDFAVTVNTWDKVRGTRHIEGAKGFVITHLYEIDLIINSKGLRDREFPYEKPANTKRILCLGGSFTCGYGVHAEETYPKVLEHLLNSDADTTVVWEVLNGGIGSTGTAHQLTFFSTEAYKYDPDYVLLCFSQQTDFWDNINSRLYTIEDGKLVKHDAPLTKSRRIQQVVKWVPGYNTLFAKSHLLNFVKRRITRYHYRDLANRIILPQGASSIEAAEEELTEALLTELDVKCAERGCELVMTAIPLSVEWIWYPETVKFFEHAASLNIPIVDLRPTMREASEKGQDIDYRVDKHWTPYGHRLAAQEIYEFFRRLGGGASEEVEYTHQDT
jgi:hypothetical protein